MSNNISIENLETNFELHSDEMVKFDYVDKELEYRVIQTDILNSNGIIFKRNFLADEKILLPGIFLNMTYSPLKHEFELVYVDLYSCMYEFIKGSLLEIAKELEPFAECITPDNTIFNALVCFKNQLLYENKLEKEL